MNCTIQYFTYLKHSCRDTLEPSCGESRTILTLECSSTGFESSEPVAAAASGNAPTLADDNFDDDIPF